MIAIAGQKLELIDTSTGMNYLDDFIGNNCPQIIKNNAISPIDFEWLSEIVADIQKVDWRIFRLVQKYGAEAVHSITSNVDPRDVSTYAERLNYALDERFGNEGNKALH